MSKSGWIISTTLGLAVFLSGLWYSWNLFSAYQQHHSDERANATQYYSETTQHSPDACRSVMDEEGFVGWLTCLADKIGPDGGVKQSEYDLEAQQDMAAWAFGMLIITVWLTLITLFGVFFVWRTLKATQEMAKDTRYIGIAQTRPWLSLKLEVGSDLIFNEEGARIAIIATLVNHGHSPAIAVDIRFETAPLVLKEMDVLEEIRVRPFVASPKRSLFGYRIFPKEPHRHRSNIPIPISTEEFSRGMISPVVVCSVRYQTPGDPQSQHFTDIAMSLVDTESGMGLGMSTKVGVIPLHRLTLQQSGLGAVQ
jgi:hypothetical protein